MANYTRFDPANPPPPLMTSTPGSFPHRTMTTRIPAIVQQVIKDHTGTYPPEIIRALQNLHHEVKLNRPVRPLETTAPDGPEWREAWRPHRGKTWLNIPWYFAEAFFYRRLLEAAGYFGSDAWAGVDPFLPNKQAELQSDQPWHVLSATLTRSVDNSAASFRALLHSCVWGNRVDLSYKQVAEATGREIAVDSEQANLLVDDTEAVLAHLRPGSNRVEKPQFNSPRPHRSPSGLSSGRRLRPKPALLPRIDFISDNSGTELLLDLALADFLLRFNWAGKVTLHLKAHPTFVSDATPADVEMTIAAMKTVTADRRPLTVERAAKIETLAGRLESYRPEERLCLQSHLFWNSSYFFWQLPSALQAELAQAHLVILKGDANYRRLLGDSAAWLPTAPVAEAVPYFPAPFVALRTMKSDPVVGLKPGQAEKLAQEDAEWRVNGKRGMIQAVLK